MMDSLYQMFLPEINSTITMLKILLPLGAVGSILFFKTKSNTAVDDNDAKKADKRVRQIAIGLVFCVVLLLFIDSFTSKYA